MTKTNKKILVIDDDPMILEVFKIILMDIGYVVETTSDIVKIYEKIKEFNPNVIFLDVMMPNTDGAYLLDKIKNSKDLSKIQVVLVSALHDLKSIAKQYKADAYIHKPFDIEEIEKTINKL